MLSGRGLSPPPFSIRIMSENRGSLCGTVYGDLVGSPFMTENIYDRYFDLGTARRAWSRGRVRTFLPTATEVTHGAAAVCRWLSVHRDDPSAENLIGCLADQYDAHPNGGWTDTTRLFLTSGRGEPSGTPDWAAVARAVPVASFFPDDLFRALELAEACAAATCSDPDTARMAMAVTHAVHMAHAGRDRAEIFTVLDMQYGLMLSRPDADLRAELRGEVPEPLVLMGAPVPGEYRYVPPSSPAPPSSRIVAEAALRSVLSSDGWEDAVRRAVAWGGPSNAVAGIAGGFAEALYGDITPAVVGRLYPVIPMDVSRQMESFQRMASVRVERDSPAYRGMADDAVTLIGAWPDPDTFVVPEERRDLRNIIGRQFPDAAIITPGEKDAFLEKYKESRSGTHAYGPRPEERTLYVQDRERMVTPSGYSAPGMPPLQERRRHLSEFMSLRAWCVERQSEMNAASGNAGAGQIHYGNAYHMWIGRRRIDFLMGDVLAGSVLLDRRGLLKVDLGEWRDVGVDARFEGYREQEWASRSLFPASAAADPMGHLSDIRDAVLSRLLDEGAGMVRDADGRRSDGEDTPVCNLDRLEALSPGEPRGLPPQAVPGERLGAVRPQAVRTVYTIGYGGRSREAFANTLRMLGADTVVDVRENPSGRFAPQFEADALYDFLSGQGIAYLLGGERLGNTPDWTALRESERYREGLDSIRRLADEGRVVAIASSEGDPLRSHRFGTVARDLAEGGTDVRHVMPDGEVVSHAVLEDRLLERCKAKGGISSVLTGTYREQLEEAYAVLARERSAKPVRKARPRIHR